MFENPIIFSIFIGIITTVGYILLYDSKLDPKDKKKNYIILFSSVFIISLFINVCFFCNEKPSNSVGGNIKLDNIPPF